MNTSRACDCMFLRSSLGKVRKAFKHKLNLFFYQPLSLFVIFNGVWNMPDIFVSHKGLFHPLIPVSDIGVILACLGLFWRVTISVDPHHLDLDRNIIMLYGYIRKK